VRCPPQTTNAIIASLTSGGANRRRRLGIDSKGNVERGLGNAPRLMNRLRKLCSILDASAHSIRVRSGRTHPLIIPVSQAPITHWPSRFDNVYPRSIDWVREKQKVGGSFDSAESCRDVWLSGTRGNRRLDRLGKDGGTVGVANRSMGCGSPIRQRDFLSFSLFDRLYCVGIEPPKLRDRERGN
jgi:hypothetical protein